MQNYKKRLENALPVFSNMLKRTKPMVMSQGVAGAVAGTVAVSKIKKEDQLISVMHHSISSISADLTEEFVITGDGTIANVGGTDSSSDFLIVTWMAWDAD